MNVCCIMMNVRGLQWWYRCTMCFTIIKQQVVQKYRNTYNNNDIPSQETELSLWLQLVCSALITDYTCTCIQIKMLYNCKNQIKRSWNN